MFGFLFKLTALTLPLLSMVSDQRLSYNSVLDRLGLDPQVGSDKIGKTPLKYDYIIVGAGSAGSVLANRLSEDGNTSVLLLEAGGNENALSDMPVAYQMLQRTELDWAYETTSQKHSCLGFKGNSSFWPRGKVLGGTSVLNAMLYVRGNRRDYNRWPDGWKWDDVFPYFLKSENCKEREMTANGSHALGGPLDVCMASYVTPLGEAFVESAPELGYQHLLDYNGPQQAGFALAQSTVRNGSRCSTAKAFLYPIYKRPNLRIIINALATQILFDEHKRAVGVKYERSNKTHKAYASKEVIISAGAINSPQLLLLSGVGPSKDLKKLSVPVVADLAGVGRNLQDHIFPGGLYFSIDQPVSLNPTRVMTPDHIMQYFIDGKGPISTSGCDALAFVSTKYASKDWPDFEMHMIPADVVPEGGEHYKRVVKVKDRVWPYFEHHMNRPSFSIFAVMLRPKSRGYIKLRSVDPYEHPIINPNYLSHREDVATMVEGLKLGLKIGQSNVFRRKYGSRVFDMPVPGCEMHEFLSDKYLECVARTLTWTLYHPVGTCKMVDPREDYNKSGVVDTKLRVLGGIKGLRVVDASIMPHIVSGNPNAAIIMIAEHAADLIRFGEARESNVVPGPKSKSGDGVPAQSAQ